MKEVKISGMGFMGEEEYYGTVLSKAGEFYTIDLGDPCPIEGKIIVRHEMWVTPVKNN